MLRLVSECSQACLWSASGDSEFDLCLVLYLFCLGGPLEWDDQDNTRSLRGSCINLKPYMFVNLKKHTLLIKKKV